MSTPVVIVTVTGTTTVLSPTGFTTLVSSRTFAIVSPTTSAISKGPIVSVSSRVRSGSASTLPPSLPSTTPTASTPSSLTPLPSNWPSPTAPPALSKLNPHNNTIAILSLIFLVLLCFIFVLFLAFFVFQKWKGDCSKCKSLQGIIDKYASGKLVPITKETCKERESWFEAGARRERERALGEKLENTWSLGFNSGSGATAEMPVVRIITPPLPPVLARHAQAKEEDATVGAGPSKHNSNGSGCSAQSHSTSSHSRDGRSLNVHRQQSLRRLEGKGPNAPEQTRQRINNGGGFSANCFLQAAEKKPKGNARPTSSTYPPQSPYNDVGTPNPYAMNSTPTGDDQSRTFATYDEHHELARPDPRQPYLMEHISGPELAQQYHQACHDAGRADIHQTENTGKASPALYEQTQKRHRSGAYGRFTPPAAMEVGFVNVDLEGRGEREKERAGWF
ncbi:hypothetical protein K458DRAFT_394641 [Lentithecium fluviatile CBS 122367]|uniref:Uncharacterized protein n=1 Tax=Lentithecium fluviatile CBS 122367 TaxID=1168545 RepID=A0A6G1ILA6_9PLEO|nr:hypothetical protein K458DRAFT_394641 [Lentithecium fluviatile CBS 122367]